MSFAIDSIHLFGASIAEQSANDRNKSAEQSYSEFFQACGFGNIVVNDIDHSFANSGHDSVDYVNKVDAFVASLPAENALVVVHGPGNDVTANGPYPGGAAAIDTNMRSVMETITSAGHRVMYGPITYRIIPGSSNDSEPYNTNIINAIGQQYSPDFYDEDGNPIFDLYSFTEARQNLFEGDGTHPNDDLEHYLRNYIAKTAAQTAYDEQTARLADYYDKTVVINFGPTHNPPDNLSPTVEIGSVGPTGTEGAIAAPLLIASDGTRLWGPVIETENIAGANTGGRIVSNTTTSLSHELIISEFAFINVETQAIGSSFVRIKDLPNGLTGTLSITGSRDTTATNRVALFTVQGSSQTLDAALSPAPIIQFPFEIVNNELVIQMDLDGTSIFGYINGAQLEFDVLVPEISGPSSITLAENQPPSFDFTTTNFDGLPTSSNGAVISVGENAWRVVSAVGFDFEVDPNPVVTITVNDGFSPPVTLVIPVNLTNVIEQTVTAPDPLTIVIPEGAALSNIDQRLLDWAATADADSNNLSEITFAAGDNDVIFSRDDALDEAATVTVIEQLAPVISSPTSISIQEETTLSIDFSVTNFSGTPSISDGVLSDLGGGNYQAVIENGYDFEATPSAFLQITANDGLNAPVVRSVSINVNNVFENTIVDAGPLVINTEYGETVSLATVNTWAQGFTGATSNNLNTLSFPLSGGVYSVTFTAFDAAPVTRTITVNEAARPDPVITLSGVSGEGSELTLSTIVSQPFTLPEFTAQDADGEDLTDIVQVTGEVNINAKGDYQIVYSVTDNDMQSSQVTLTVSVVSAPLVDLISQASVQNLFSPRQIVYTGRDNRFVVAFSHQGQELDFDGVDRFQLINQSGQVIVDTDISPDAIAPLVERDSLGKLLPALEFKLGALPANRHKNPVTLVAYDFDHPNGQVIVHASDNKLFIQYRGS